MKQIIMAEDTAKQDEQRMLAMIGDPSILLPASLVKQVKKRIVVRKKEAKCSTC